MVGRMAGKILNLVFQEAWTYSFFFSRLASIIPSRPLLVSLLFSLFTRNQSTSLVSIVQLFKCSLRLSLSSSIQLGARG